MEIIYTIPGVPIPLARPRHGNHKVYDPQKHEKLVLGINLRNQHGDLPPIEGPILLEVTFYMPIAKCHAKRHDALMDTYNFFKPDLSNLIKMVEDVSQDVGLYKDDCQIVAIIAKKIYGEPRTEFTLTRIG